VEATEGLSAIDYRLSAPLMSADRLLRTAEGEPLPVTVDIDFEATRLVPPTHGP